MRGGVFRRAGLAAAVALIAGSALAAPAAPPSVLAKPGGDYDQRAKDRATCRATADAAPVDDLPQVGERAIPTGYAADLPTAIGGSIAFALIAAIDISHARGRAQAFCLMNLGYVFVPLTADEAGAQARLTGGDRERWERSFLAQDLAPRIGSLTRPLVPPLPAYRTEPATQGGLKVDLASLKATEAPSEAGGVLITGRLARGRTATLAAPFETTEGRIRVAGQAGAVFHQVDYRPQRSPLLRNQGATWCGPVQQIDSAGNRSRDVYCFTSFLDGYDVFRPSGFDWMAGPYGDGFILARFKGPITLAERDLDDVGALDLEVRVTKVSGSHLELEAYSIHAERSVRIWTRRLALKPEGTVILPLWSRRAVISRTANTVTAKIDDQGDGRGWRDLD